MTAAVAARPVSAFDLHALRADFPALDQQIHGRPLVYLDNAASSQTPVQVVDALTKAYLEDRSNIHRGVHTLSQRATTAFEAVRGKVQAFLGAEDEREIIFTRGTTESLNLVAYVLAAAASHDEGLKAGDEILVCEAEHHSNIVPWQIMADRVGATVRMIPIDERGCIDVDAYKVLLGDKTKVVAVAHASNALGTVHPVRELADLAHEHGALVVVDGAQGAPHLKVDVQALGADFYAFGAHKMFGPTGIGVLWSRRELLDRLPPFHGGGDMIEQVSFDGTTFAKAPSRFEAGTPDITGVIAFGACLDYWKALDVEAAFAHEDALLAAATERVQAIDGLRVIGTAPHKVAVLSFTVDGVHPHDLGMLLDEEGVAVRTGHHCAQPAMVRFGVPATTRASFAMYNTFDEVDVFVTALHKALKLLR
jgi:cysteine desulfurase/selenocysteine lyase